LRGMQPSKNTGILTLEQTDTEIGWQAQTTCNLGCIHASDGAMLNS
jgi:hypothetical protein